MTNKQDKDPELVEDLNETVEEVPAEVELPEYDPLQFELPEDFEYVEDDGNG